MITKIEGLIEIAGNSALKAGKIILKLYEEQVIQFEIKEDQSPLTAADKGANKIICDDLEKTGIPILSEEGQKIPFNERRQWKEYWLIDPLDGSKEFINRNGEFTVNIALMSGTTPIAGVVYAPCLDLMYLANGNNKVYRICNGARDQLIPTKTKNWPEDFMKLGTVRIVASRSHMNKQTEEFLHFFNKTELLSMGSSLKFMLLADNRADVYPRLAPTMEWDTAASHAILMALNRNIYQAGSNNPLCYNKESLINPGFIAC